MRFEVPRPKKSGWTKWIQPTMQSYFMACCDCGLVHTMDFRVAVDTKNACHVQFRVRRNHKETRNERKKKNITLKHE